MAEPRKEKLTPELVELRLRELGELYELGVALREVRILSGHGEHGSCSPPADLPTIDPLQSAGRPYSELDTVSEARSPEGS